MLKIKTHIEIFKSIIYLMKNLGVIFDISSPQSKIGGIHPLHYEDW